MECRGVECEWSSPRVTFDLGREPESRVGGGKDNRGPGGSLREIRITCVNV